MTGNIPVDMVRIYDNVTRSAKGLVVFTIKRNVLWNEIVSIFMFLVVFAITKT